MEVLTTGAGTTIRMKSTMESHVDTTRNTMFRQACDAVKGQLDQMCAEIEKHMTASVDNLSTKIHRDYLATLVGEGAEVPLAERMLHEQVRPILEDAGSRFAQFSFPASGEAPAAARDSEQ